MRETERMTEMDIERERRRVRLQVGDSVDFVMSPKISRGRIPNPKTNPNMFLRFGLRSSSPSASSPSSASSFCALTGSAGPKFIDHPVQ